MSKAKVTQNQKGQKQNQSKSVNVSSSNRNVLRNANKRSQSSASSSSSSSSSISSTASNLAPQRGEPWNHQQFLQRVATYNSLKWHIKRKDISPLLCARFGWKCVQINTLQCSTCLTKIQYKTNAIWTTEINNKVAQSFLQNVRRAHTDECIWKQNPCDESFECLPMDTNLMKQQLIENLKTWTQKDVHAFYIIPKLDSTAKRQMIASIGNANSVEEHSNHNKRSKDESGLNWMNHATCCDVMLLSGAGWYLSATFGNNRHSTAISTPYVQCRYCNKCISLQSYDYKKILSLLPESVNASNRNNSFLNAINEDSENDEIEEEKMMELEQKMDDKEEKEADADGGEEDISAILNRELPINDTDSVMYRLSKLGLKINTNIRRTHSFQIYETTSLQKPACFNNTAEGVDTRSSSVTSTMTLSSSSSSFGAFRSFGAGGFGANQLSLSCSQSMRWPKQSILTQPNLRSLSGAQSSGLVKSQKPKRKNKKRRREQMAMDPLGTEEHQDRSIEVAFEDEEVPRKKYRVSTSSEIIEFHEQNDNDNDNEEENKENDDNREDISNTNTNNSIKPDEEIKHKANQRRNRKRKTMESEFEEESQLVLHSKRRKVDAVDNQNTSNPVPSVSTTVSLPSSSSSTTPLRALRGPQQKRSKKRKYNDVFEEDEDAELEEEEDEDVDVKTEVDDAVSMHQRPPQKKKARLDTPIVRQQLHFDPIKSHNQHDNREDISNTNTNNSIKPDEEIKHKANQRRNRKRKTMESEFEEESQLTLHSKRRKVDAVDNQNTSNPVPSVSTTVSLPSSSSSTTPLRALRGPQQKRSKKRKYNDVFEEDEDAELEEEEDEDVDVKTEVDDAVSMHQRPPQKKKARLDTPIVRQQLHFDPIKSHNQHCPFLMEHKHKQS
eukprot:CAMPEP_0197073020 /NCGR_PEP_ID=MMETSP1384-20130603/210390_1 /TAXON_ID=29189 /ORGANISM="Ammonia sp." /LENGTH=893 /DNA_ID=CAMNT_0042511845 /DNA_START=34 /DNA_END=2711 /DNA_ORIENTATION=+